MNDAAARRRQRKGQNPESIKLIPTGFLVRLPSVTS